MGNTAEIIACMVMICLFVAVTVKTLLSIISNKNNRHLRITFRGTEDVADVVNTAESKGCTILGIDRNEDNLGIVLHIEAPIERSAYCSLLSDLASLDQVMEICEETESNLIE